MKPSCNGPGERGVVAPAFGRCKPRHGFGSRADWVRGLTLGLALAGLGAGDAPAEKALPLPDGYTIDVWQVEQGLPGNSVTSIAQTPDGYLWFGTFNGLVRFDGIQFKVFDSRTPGLESDRVLRLSVDGQGGLWVFMEHGELARFAHGRFRAFHREDGWPMEPSAESRGLVMDRSGSMLFLTRGGHLLRFDGQRFVTLAVDLSPAAWLECLVEADDGRLWIREGNRLGYIEDDKWTEFAGAGVEPPFKPGTMTQTRDGGIWVFDATRLRQLRRGQVATESIPYPPVLGPVCLEEDSTGHIWIGTWGDGLVRLARDGAYEKRGVAEGFPNDFIRVIFEDREGNLWVGTNGGGLARLKPQIFSTVDRRRDFPAPYPTPLALFEDETAGLWIGCLDSGLLQRSMNGGLREMMPKEEATTGVWALLKGRSGAVWLGTYGRGLGRLQGDKLQWWRGSQGLPKGDSVVALCEGHDGTLWLGGDGGGLSRFDGQRFINYTTKDGLRSDQVRALTEDRSGALWIGTIGGGLNCLRDGQFTAFTRTNGLPHDSVRALLADADGSLWIGTGRGLARLRGGRLVDFHAIRDLTETEITVILDDGLGYLWCGSNRGIVRVARAELEAFARGERQDRDWLQYTSYGRGDGLASAQISGGQPAGLRARDGRLWFATANGLSVVSPQQLQPNRVAPPVAIEELSVNGRPVGDAWPLGRVEVPPGRSRLEFRYTGLSLTAPERVRFRRKLEGFDREWQDVGTERVASYAGLPPANYRFRVMAANNDGVWNETGASLAFIVLPAWYQTGWFRALAATGVFGAVAGFFRIRMRALERRQAAQEAFSRALIQQQEEERRRIASELHDSLEQNLLVIKNRALLALGQGESSAALTQSLEQISSVSSGSIEEVRTIAGNLRPHQLDRLGLTRALTAMLRGVAESSGLSLTSDIAELKGQLTKEAEINLYRIAQESLNNIIKHARATEASVTLQRAAGRLRLRICDNGRGFDARAALSVASEGSGFGLAGMAERARILGGQLKVTSAPGRGTQLEAHVPCPAVPSQKA